MSEKTRLDVLSEVNAVFESEGLQKWDNLRHIGKHRDGEFEITGVSHVIRDLKQYYIIVIFDVLRPDGSVGQYGVRFTTRIPTCVVAIVNDEVLFIQQHRLPTSRWMVELPRGWIQQSVAEACKGGTAQALLEREVGVEWIRGLDSINPVLLGSVWEDTGTRADQVQIYLVQIRTTISLPKRCRCGNTRLYDWNRIRDMILNGVINDQTTLTALFKAQMFLSS